MFNFPDSENKRFLDTFENILRIILLYIVFLVIIFFILYSARAIFYPYVIHNVEGLTLSFSILLKEKGNYFYSIHDYPFLHGAYPPLYPFLTSLFLSLDHPSFLPGRLLTFISTLIIILLLMNVFLHNTKFRSYAFLLPVIFITPFFVLFNASSYRVDMLAVLLSFVGLLIYERYYKKNSPVRFVSILFFILAFYTKQNAIIAPLSVLAYNFFKNKKEFTKFFFLYTPPLVFIFFVLNYLTNGEFYRHIVTYTFFLGFDYWKVFTFYQSFIGYTFLLIIFFLFNLIVLKKYHLFSVYFVLNFISIFTLSKPGAGDNYFIEPFLSLILVSGLTFLNIIENFYHQKQIRTFFTALIIIQLTFLVPYKQGIIDFVKYPYPYTMSIHETRTKLQNYLKDIKGPVLSEDLGFLAINKLPLFLESFQLAWLAHYKMWDPQLLVQDCRDQKFSMIILGTRIRSITDLFDCINEKYILIDTLEESITYQIYIPRKN